MIENNIFFNKLAAGLLLVSAATFSKMPVHAQNAPFSPVIEANGVIYLAGHLGRDPQTRALPDGIKAQTRQTLENIGATLASVNATHTDIVRCQVFLDDIKDFSAMNEVYRTFFPQNPPARTTVAVSGLALNAEIEIECTAVRGHGSRHAGAQEGRPDE